MRLEENNLKKILFYQIRGEKRKQLKKICGELDIEILVVSPAEYGEPVGALVPASVRVVCEGALCRCRVLKIVEFEVGSRLERLGKSCFERVGGARAGVFWLFGPEGARVRAGKRAEERWARGVSGDAAAFWSRSVSVRGSGCG